MPKFFCGFQKNDIYGPQIKYYQLHDPLGHREVHGGGVDQVPIYEKIYVQYMFYA